jgi:hypothetical protein
MEDAPPARVLKNASGASTDPSPACPAAGLRPPARHEKALGLPSALRPKAAFWRRAEAFAQGQGSKGEGLEIGD